MRAIPLGEELAGIRRRCAALPVLDTRTVDEILGYAEPLLFKGDDFARTDIRSAHS